MAESYTFANNFWGKEDMGVQNLLQRMHDAKQTCEEVHGFFKERIAIEEEYSKRLLALSRKGLGSNELGTLRQALDIIRTNTEAMGRCHGSSAQQIKKELSDPLESFSNSLRLRRKTVEGTVDKLFKAKNAQNAVVERSRTKFETDCNKINGYFAQQNLLMGRELEKNNIKLDKAHMSVDTTRREYQNSLRVLAETIDRWNKEWKDACDKFQDLEEERINFLKSNLWAYTNVVSTVCVSDDEGSETIRLALEKCDVQKDIEAFVKAKGTGAEILDPPEFVNFLQGYSRESTPTAFKVASFERGGGDQLVVAGEQQQPPPQNELIADYEQTSPYKSVSSSSFGESSPPHAVTSPYSDTAATGDTSTYGSSPYTAVGSSLSASSPYNAAGVGLDFDATPALSAPMGRSAQGSPIQSSLSNSSMHSSTSISSPEPEEDNKKRTWASPFRRTRSKKDLSKGWKSPGRNEDTNATVTPNSGIAKQLAEKGPNIHRSSVLSMGENMFDLGVSSTNRSYDSIGSRSPSPGKKMLPRDDPLLVALERLKVSPTPSGNTQLSAPNPAFTATEMQETSDKYTTQTKQLFDDQPSRYAQRPRSTVELRQRSTGDLREDRRRSTSPNPQLHASTMRERPKSPYIEGPTYEQQQTYRNHQRSKSSSPMKAGYDYSYSPQGDPYAPMSTARQQYHYDYEYQQSYQQAQPKSRSSVDMRSRSRQSNPGYPTQSRDGRPIIRYSRAAYDYRAAIPEEVSFRKGDIMLVMRMQEDGWWDVEVLNSGRAGLAPSNFLVNAV
jgi:hypothetical protein